MAVPPPLAVPRSQESGNIVAGSAVYYLFIYIYILAEMRGWGGVETRSVYAGGSVRAVVGIRGAGSSM